MYNTQRNTNKKSGIRRALLVLFLISIFSTSKAQNADSIAYLLDSAFAKSPFYGNVLITVNNKTFFEKSYGYADAIQKKPLTAANSFQVASISKQFTAYGIMILKSKNLLDYDSLVCKYIPLFPYSNITIRHLLNHTAGLPNFWDNIRPNMDTTKPNGNKEVLAYLIQNKMALQFEPGTQFAYADIGYDFLAMIIENVSKLSYSAFMHKNIFKPLGMKSTFAYMVTDIRNIQNNKLAIGHTLENGKFLYAHLQTKYHFVYYLGNFYGDGSIVSTAKDLAIWDKALKNYLLLPFAIQNEAIIPATNKGETISTRKNANIGYGFGWFIKNTPAGNMVYHSGGHPGNTHIIYRLLDKNCTFIFLSNAETDNIKVIRNRVLQSLY